MAIMTVELRVPAEGSRPALQLRPWLAADMPALLAEMRREYPSRGLYTRWGYLDLAGVTGPRDPGEADEWVAGQDRGWRDGDFLTFAVLQERSGRLELAGHAALKNRDGAGRVGERETAEIGYWTAVPARGQGVASAAVRAVTGWAAASFGAVGLRRIMLVHDVDNPASCRVAERAGYPFAELSPAQPPLWYTDGHIHLYQLG
jgi:RimJ/RimL family protein N-acetyltransferase